MVSESVFVGNMAGGGGAILNDTEFAIATPVLMLSDSTIAGNGAPGGSGGGLRNVGIATLTRTTISANTASGGAGILNVGSLALINCTLSENVSAAGGGGDALEAAGGSVNLSSVTITRNGVGGNEAVLDTTLNGDSILMRNSIIVGNLGQDCAARPVSLGYNVFGSCTPDNDDPTSIEGFFETTLPLADNGGPTQSCALFMGSPAVDAGNPAGCTDHLGNPITTDQRGVPRPKGSRCDAGAYEYDGLCLGGTRIESAVLTVDHLGPPLGDERLIFEGRLVFAPGTPAIFDPAAQGAQVLVQDVLGLGALFDLSYGTYPVLPGLHGSGCKPRDGWGKTAYTNRSNAIDPPACTPSSANGLRRVKFRDRRSRHGFIEFKMRTRNSAILDPGTPDIVAVGVVLGADQAASQSGSCGTRQLAHGVRILEVHAVASDARRTT